MPVSYELDRAMGMIRTRCYGNVLLDEVIGHFRSLKLEADLPKTLDVLLDLREMTSSPTAERIRSASKGPGLLSGLVQFRYCAVVASREALYGMARMWGILAEEFFTDISVFRKVDEAETWLRLHRKEESGRARNVTE